MPKKFNKTDNLTGVLLYLKTANCFVLITFKNKKKLKTIDSFRYDIAYKKLPISSVKPSLPSAYVDGK